MQSQAEALKDLWGNAYHYCAKDNNEVMLECHVDSFPECKDLIEFEGQDVELILFGGHPSDWKHPLIKIHIMLRQDESCF